MPIESSREFLVWSALVSVAIGIVIPILRLFDATRPHAIIIVLGASITVLILFGLWNYRNGFPFDEEIDGED